MADRVSDDRRFRLNPGEPGVITMPFQPQEGPQAKPDMSAPRAGRAHLRSFDQTERLYSARIVLNRARTVCPLDPLQSVPLQLGGGPVVNVPVCGDNLEHAEQALAFPPHPAPV